VQATLRFAQRGAALTLAVAISYPFALSPKPAGADTQPSQTQLQAAAIRYNAASGKADAIGLQLAKATADLASAQAQIAVMKSRLRVDAIDSFVNGNSVQTPTVLANGAGDEAMVRNEYLHIVTGDTQDAIHRLNQAESALKAQQQYLLAEQRAAQEALAAAAAAKGQLDSALDQLPAVATSATPLTGNKGMPLPVQYLHGGSVDDGVDYAAPGGTPEFAMGPGVVIKEGISGFGPNAPVIHITGGPLAGREVYYGHAGPDLVHVGDTVQQDQQITIVGYGIVGESTGPHLEIGFNPPSGSPGGRPMLNYINSVLGTNTGG
jgi:murein DD-endopeptidase MepM/ murein hydrolase activator NlpD